MQEGLVRRPFHRQVHDGVERGQRRLGAVVAGGQADHLAHRRDGLAGEDHQGDDAALAELALGNAVDAGDEHAHHGQVHDEIGKMADRAGEQPRATGPGGDVADRLLPGALDLALRAQHLDGLDAGEALDQDGVLLRRGGEAPLHRLFQRRLHRQGEQPHEGDRRQVDVNDGSAQVPDGGQAEQHEGQVDERGDRKRGDEVAHRLELLQVLGEGADRFGPDLEAQAEHLFEQGRGDAQVGLLAGLVDEVAAQAAQQQAEPVDHADAERQHPERLEGQVGDDPVVDDHGEEGTGQAEQVDHQRGEQHVPVDPPGAGQGAPEPVPGGVVHPVVEMAVLAEPGADEQGVAAVEALEFGERQPRLAQPGFRQQYRGLTGLVVEGGEQAGAAVGEQQHGRQLQAGHAGERPFEEPRRQSGPFGGPGEQLHGQPVVDQRQAGAQGGARGRQVVQPAELDQAVGERIVDRFRVVRPAQGVGGGRGVLFGHGRWQKVHCGGGSSCAIQKLYHRANSRIKGRTRRIAMLSIERNEAGAIVAIRNSAGIEGVEPASLLDEEVLAFLRASGELDALAQLLALSDNAIVRVLEDLIDLLIDKKLILFTELPAAAQEKLSGRKRIRQQLGSGDLMVDDVL